MPRRPKPYFRKTHKTYFATIGGRVTNLQTADAHEAWVTFCELSAEAAGGKQPQAANLTYLELASRFLDWSERHRRPSTYDEHRRYVSGFAKFLGPDRRVEGVIPNDLTGFLDAVEDRTVCLRKPKEAGKEDEPAGNVKPFGPGGRRAATVAIKRSINWGMDEGLIRMNPLARVKVRRSKRRGRSLTAPEVASLLEAADKPFREFLTLALETGARPDELYRLEARHVVGGRIIFEAHEAKGGIERRIVLTKAAAELVGRLVAARPIGALLRNERGEPWNRMAIHSRMWRLQQAGKLPAGISPYSLRHSFATLAIMRGVGLEELRVLMGHKTLDMIAWHYSHIDQQDQHLRDAAERATATVTATTKSVRGDVPT